MGKPPSSGFGEGGDALRSAALRAPAADDDVGRAIEPCRSQGALAVPGASVWGRLARLHAELSSLYAEVAREHAPALEAARTTQAPKGSAPCTPRALRAKDVAARLGVSERKVREMRASGELPPTLPVSNVCRWDAAVIEQWVKERARG
jgi:predicted DNA-binding transcriptional regulator AlpA